MKKMKRLLLVVVATVVATVAHAQHRQDYRGAQNTGSRVVYGTNAASGQQSSQAASTSPQAQGGSVQVYGLVHGEGAVFFGEKKWMNPTPNNASLRRTRIGLKKQFDEHWSGEMCLEYSDNKVTLKDACARFTQGGFRFRGGHFVEDFSMEMSSSESTLTTLERTMPVNAFAPSRHIGFDARWRHKWFYVSSGVFFQRVGNKELSGRDQGMAYTEKLIFNPFYEKKDFGVHIGVGASYRNSMTDVSEDEYGGFRYSVSNSSAINRMKYLDTRAHGGVTSYELLANAEFAMHYKGLRFQGEYLMMNNVLKTKLSGDYAGIRDYRFGGLYGMCSYMLFGGSQRYDKGSGTFTSPSRGRSWGDVELVARYDYLDLTDRNIYGGTGENYILGVNYHASQNIKFMLNYQYARNDRYANGGGSYFVGATALGTPTTEPNSISMNDTAGVRYHMVGLRMQVVF